MRLFRKKVAQVPLWTWLVATLPWSWAIPANHYFWDDWMIQAHNELSEQIQYWSGGAKHPLNPWVYGLLLPLGPWALQSVVLAALVGGTWAIGRIAEISRIVPAELIPAVRLIFAVLPVFHARFSVATLEYSLALCLLLVAWTLLLTSSRRSPRLLAGLLLVYAIGVPSLAALFPVLFAQVVWVQSKTRRREDLLKSGLRNLPILVLPVLAALVFRFAVDTEGKYQASIGAIIEFTRLLVVLGVVSTVSLIVVSLSRPNYFRPLLRIVISGLASYLGLFPYFAVGYNPLTDFLPWRMRDSASEGLAQHLFLFGLVTMAVCLLAGFVGRSAVGRHHVLPWCFFVGPAWLFALAVTAVGPLDWESRHFLVTWPLLAVFFSQVIATSPIKIRSRVASATIAVLLVASLVISAEYFVDIQKQRALVASVDDEVGLVSDTPLTTGQTLIEIIQMHRPFGDFDKSLGQDDPNQLVVVVETTSTSHLLNARFRGYRPYEWAGLMGKGLNREALAIHVLESKDLGYGRSAGCSEPIRAVLIAPTVNSTRLTAFLGRRLSVNWNAEGLLICYDPEFSVWRRI
jgi:hypothetical protein